MRGAKEMGHGTVYTNDDNGMRVKTYNNILELNSLLIQQSMTNELAAAPIRIRSEYLIAHQMKYAKIGKKNCVINR